MTAQPQQHPQRPGLQQAPSNAASQPLRADAAHAAAASAGTVKQECLPTDGVPPQAGGGSGWPPALRQQAAVALAAAEVSGTDVERISRQMVAVREALTLLGVGAYDRLDGCQRFALLDPLRRAALMLQLRFIAEEGSRANLVAWLQDLRAR